MAERSHITGILRRELQQAVCMPDYDTYIKAVSEVNHQGEVFWTAFRCTRNGKYLLRKMVSNEWNLRESDIVRISGFGSALTAYFIGMLPFTDLQRKKMIHCGTLANLVVTVFDFMADSGKLKNTDLLEHVLLGNPRHRVGYLKRLLLLCKAGNHQRFMLNLIKEYFSSLHQAVGPDKELDPLYKLIRNMYLAEKQTLLAPDKVTETQWVRKSVLPFLIMAAPAWLLAGLSKKELIWQVRWFYKFGITIGSVDDGVDFEQDIENGAPNIFVIRKMTGASETEYIAFFKQVVSDIHALQLSWKQRAEGGISLTNEFLPAVVVTSWVGGPLSVC